MQGNGCDPKAGGEATCPPSFLPSCRLGRDFLFPSIPWADAGALPGGGGGGGLSPVSLCAGPAMAAGGLAAPSGPGSPAGPAAAAARDLFAEGLLDFLRPAVRQLDTHVHAVR